MYIHTVCFFVLDNFIFGEGGYNNAKLAKSYLVFIFLGSWHFLGITSLLNASCLLPKFKVQKSVAAAASFFILDVVSYHLLLLSTLKIWPRQRPKFEIWFLLAINMFEYQNSKFDRASGRFFNLASDYFFHIYIYIYIEIDICVYTVYIIYKLYFYIIFFYIFIYIYIYIYIVFI